MAAAREEAISYAAYRVLSSRFIKAVGGDESLSEFADVMDIAVLPARRDDDRRATAPAALGNRIAAAVLATGLEDGSNQANGYAAPDYTPVNPPLVVARSGHHHDRPEPLAAAPARAHDQPERHPGRERRPAGRRAALGPRQRVRASRPRGDAGVPIDPGPPPLLGDPARDQAYKDQAVEVIRDSSLLDPADRGRRSTSRPASVGGNIARAPTTARGHAVNPATGQPYAPQVVKRGDFTRALAEFWADGPKSETPPGHWNVIANHVSRRARRRTCRIGGQRPSRSTGSSGTSSSTWRSTARSTTPPSRPGA